MPNGFIVLDGIIGGMPVGIIVLVPPAVDAAVAFASLVEGTLDICTNALVLLTGEVVPAFGHNERCDVTTVDAHGAPSASQYLVPCADRVQN
jgi:hypothetical protein